VLFNLLSVTLLPAINLKRSELRNWRGCGVRPGGLKLGELEDEYVAAEEAFDDPALTLAERNKLRNLKRQLIRDMNEMCGHLLTRTAVAVESPLPLRHEILGFDWEKWRDQLEHTRDSAPAPTASSEPGGPGLPLALLLPMRLFLRSSRNVLLPLNGARLVDLCRGGRGISDHSQPCALSDACGWFNPAFLARFG
jgi:hypothetical protein